MAKKFLVKHRGNLGDLVFLVPPILATLKRVYPNCHITLVTAWGFRDSYGRWGTRNFDGAGIALMMTNPHVDQLVHWHDTKLSLDSQICVEEGQRFPTWSRDYYHQQAHSGNYDQVLELDVGLPPASDPLAFLYRHIGLPEESYSEYRLYLTEQDQAIATELMQDLPHPRIVLLEGLAGPTTRGWDPGKIQPLENAIQDQYGVAPFWFGAAYKPYYEGRPVTLRENIALLTHGTVGIGVLAGPLHFAVAVGLPTITLYGEQPIERAAPAYFLNQYITDEKKWHRTLLGPSSDQYNFLKPEHISPVLTPAEKSRQKFKNWQQPGRPDLKACLAVITVDEIMAVLADSLK